MERPMKGNLHVGCGVGEKGPLTSNVEGDPYLSQSPDLLRFSGHGKRRYITYSRLHL